MDLIRFICKVLAIGILIMATLIVVEKLENNDFDLLYDGLGAIGVIAIVNMLWKGKRNDLLILLCAFSVAFIYKEVLGY